MGKRIRTLDFYGYDDGDITKEEVKFVKNKDNTMNSLSKVAEHKAVNKSGK